MEINSQVPRTLIIPVKSATARGGARSAPHDGSVLYSLHRSVISTDDSRSDAASCSECAGTYSICLDSSIAASGCSTPHTSISGCGTFSPVTDRQWHNCPGHCLLARLSEEAATGDDEAVQGTADVSCGGEAQLEGDDAPTTFTLRAMMTALSAKLALALRLLGERDDEVAQLRCELAQSKAMYRQDVGALTQRLEAVEPEAAPEAGPEAAEAHAAAADAVKMARTREMHTLLTLIHA